MEPTLGGGVSKDRDTFLRKIRNTPNNIPSQNRRRILYGSYKFSNNFGESTFEYIIIFEDTIGGINGRNIIIMDSITCGVL